MTGQDLCPHQDVWKESQWAGAQKLQAGHLTVPMVEPGFRTHGGYLTLETHSKRMDIDVYGVFLHVYIYMYMYIHTHIHIYASIGDLTKRDQLKEMSL